MGHSYLLRVTVLDLPKCHKFRVWEAWANNSPGRIPVIWLSVPHLIKCHLQKVWNCSGKHDVYSVLQFCVGKPTIMILELINLSEQSKCQGPRVGKKKEKKSYDGEPWYFRASSTLWLPRLTHWLWLYRGLSKRLHTPSCCLQRWCDWAEAIQPLLWKTWFSKWNLLSFKSRHRFYLLCCSG